MKLGSGEFTFEEEADWLRPPSGVAFGDIHGVATDPEDNVFIFHRATPPVVVFDRSGQFLDAWGDGVFKRPHNIHISADSSVYCVDDGGHALRKFTRSGTQLLAIDRSTSPADTGYQYGGPMTVARSGPPFNYPTGVALSPENDIYVSDGYGNARVHKFSQSGELLFSWGEPGDQAGQFRTPHCVAVDHNGLVYVGETANARLQVFSPRGEPLAQWTDVRRGSALCVDGRGHVYVAEAGLTLQGHPHAVRVVADAPRARITVRDHQGCLIAEWEGSDPYFSPHGLAIDSQGDVYVAEVPSSASSGTAPKGHASFHKFRNVS
jgi:hypothetical protein